MLFLMWINPLFISWNDDPGIWYTPYVLHYINPLYVKKKTNKSLIPGCCSIFLISATRILNVNFHTISRRITVEWLLDYIFPRTIVLLSTFICLCGYSHVPRHVIYFKFVEFKRTNNMNDIRLLFSIWDDIKICRKCMHVKS